MQHPIPARNAAPAHPLGPIVLRNPLAHPVKSRITTALLLVAFAAPLVVAACLTPDPRGLGTHRQLGFGDCGVLTLTGYPCPTCGMTTAFSHAVRGQWIAALRVQPMGCLLALADFVALAAAAITLITGRAWSPNWYRLSPAKTLITILLLFAAAWAYKIWTTRAAA